MKPALHIGGAVALILAAAAVTALGGCGLHFGYGDGDRTKAAFEPGTPGFVAEGLPVYSDTSTAINVVVKVLPSTLVFENTPGGYRSILRMRAQIERGRDRVALDAVVDTLIAASLAESRLLTPVYHTLYLPAPPGRYNVDVVVEDLQSRETTRQTFRATVYDPQQDAPFLDALRLEDYSAPERPTVVVSQTLPERMTDLRARVAFVSAPEHPAEIIFRVLRFRSDSSVANVPYGLTPFQGTLAHRGVYFEQKDTLFVARRVVSGMAHPVFPIPPLTRGVFRIEVEVDGGAKEEATLVSRDVAVVHPLFPRVASLDAMIDALAYLATPRELSYIQEAVQPEDRRRRFDRFWGDVIGNRQKASTLLERYYERVEAANLMFTSYKEGWKTDRGMVYIIMGPPMFKENTISTIIWRYDYGSNDPSATFLFERSNTADDRGHFENYVLERDPEYDYRWRRAVERWRSGDVL